MYKKLKNLLPVLALMVGVLSMSLAIFPKLASSASLLMNEQLNGESEDLDKESGNLKIDSTWESIFHQQINDWISEIGQKENQFKDWLESSYEVYPLGPGSKQWIVIIQHNQQEIGYLIMEQSTEAPLFYLIEYGRSEESVLSKEVRENPNFLTEGFFYHGLLWAKTENNTLVDLITKEKYEHVPISKVKPFWTGHLVGSLLKEDRLEQSNRDPILFLSSALASQNSIRPVELERGKQYFYRAKLLPDVIGLYNVSSMHYWEEQRADESITLFIGLEDEGIRYFSSSYLEQLGTFEVARDN